VESLTRSQRFPKTARLRKRAEFVNLSRRGVKLQSANFVLVVWAKGQQENRLGITVSGKVGNAVTRNRIKRSVREYFRRHRAELPMESDILIIARRGAAELEGHDVRAELDKIFAAQRKRQLLNFIR
jgi:ribonuclease P protein component